MSEVKLYDINRKTEIEPCDDVVSRGVFEQVMWERDIAIEQLHELGYELGQKIEPCEDAVSREAVKELIKSGVSTDTYDDVEQVCKWIDALPSVTQKSDKYRKEAKRWKNKWLKSQKSGEWIDKEFRKEEYVLTGKCSVCGRVRVIDEYCSNCGADMRGEQHG